jgi:excisionase family DNA binding protein
MWSDGEAERLFSPSELAELLGVPKSWVYARTCSDEIPHVHVGRYVRFDLHEIASWLMSQGEGRG